MKTFTDEPASKKKPRRSLLRLQDGGQPLPPQSGMAMPSAGGSGADLDGSGSEITYGKNHAY